MRLPIASCGELDVKQRAVLWRSNVTSDGVYPVTNRTPDFRRRNDWPQPSFLLTKRCDKPQKMVRVIHFASISMYLAFGPTVFNRIQPIFYLVLANMLIATTFRKFPPK